MRSPLQDVYASVNGWSKQQDLQGLTCTERGITGFSIWATVEIVVRFMCLVECRRVPWGFEWRRGKEMENQRLNRASTAMIRRQHKYDYIHVDRQTDSHDCAYMTGHLALSTASRMRPAGVNTCTSYLVPRAAAQ